MSIEIHYDGEAIFEAFADGKRIGRLFIYDDGQKWLDGIEVEEEFRKLGVATKLIQRAIDKYDAIYVSNANSIEHESNNDYTSRYLSDEGAKLVTALVERKIIESEWVQNPFGEYSSEGDFEED